MRRTFTEAWRKYRQQQPLQQLERLVAEVVRDHPEYQRLIEDPERALSQDFLPDAGQTNPFLHMGMHISLQEQLSGDRPTGVRSIYQQLATQLGDSHKAEHQMMECLGLSLWEAQRAGRMPDENAYLDCLRQLVAPT